MKKFNDQIDELCKNWALDEIFADVPKNWHGDYDSAISWLNTGDLPDGVYVWEPLEHLTYGELEELLVSRVFGNQQFAAQIVRLTRNNHKRSKK